MVNNEKINETKKGTAQLLFSNCLKSSYNSNIFLFQGINTLIHKHRKTKLVSSLQLPHNQGKTKNQSEIANALNHHFASVGPKLANSIFF